MSTKRWLFSNGSFLKSLKTFRKPAALSRSPTWVDYSRRHLRSTPAGTWIQSRAGTQSQGRQHGMRYPNCWLHCCAKCLPSKTILDVYLTGRDKDREIYQLLIHGPKTHNSQVRGQVKARSPNSLRSTTVSGPCIPEPPSLPSQGTHYQKLDCKQNS